MAISFDNEVSELIEFCKKESLTLATAESCTGGLIASALTNVSGSSTFFMGGIVAYSNKVKIKVLNVDPILIATHGAVSKDVAEAMAEGAKKVMGSTYSISSTGIAGPTGGSVEKPVGTVFIGWSGPKGAFSKRFQFDGNREAVRDKTVAAAFEILKQELVLNHT